MHLALKKPVIKLASSRPPPFIIAGLTSLRDITNLVKTVTNNLKFKNIGSSSARLTVEEGVTYRKVQNLLQSNNIPYNSWQPKEERSFRVVALGLHAETDKQDITDDLTALDHKVRNIHNAKSKTSGKQLNIFFIELEPAPNNKLIYDVKLINHQVVAFEPPNRREDIPRCYRCQEFGNTRSYCSKAVKCAKCGGSHDSKDEAICPAKSQDQYYCINCGSNHAASYRGCPAYLEAVNKREGNAPAKSAPIKRLAQTPLPRDTSGILTLVTQPRQLLGKSRPFSMAHLRNPFLLELILLLSACGLAISPMPGFCQCRSGVSPACSG
ncbi:hypothetical protein ACLKA7_002005 [Drosophila subpalustris]